MPAIRPFRAVRPASTAAARVAAVPYDVVSTDEARALAAGNPLSFLHVSRAEIDLPASVDPHDEAVYRGAVESYRRLKHDAPYLQERDPSIYLYHLESGGHRQTGVAACFSVAEYHHGIIKKHERTRQDKEDDRTRHMIALRAQTGPVFLTHRPEVRIDECATRTRASNAPLMDFEASDGVRHAIWRVDRTETTTLVEAFASLGALYIADGHHRAASAARASDALGDSEEAAFVLGVAFPSSEVRILPYHRIVRDLNGMTADRFLAAVADRLATLPGPATPAVKGQVAMYVSGMWYTVQLGSPGASPLDALDYSLLQERLLRPVLGIEDVRTDPRIDFVGGARGVRALEHIVDSGRAAVAFSMFPVGVIDLMAVADAGGIMPPKSTWFEPKLRDGLLIHEI